MDLSKLLELGMVELMATCNRWDSSRVTQILVLYVDDLFLTGPSRLIKDCKENLAAEFDMKDLGLVKISEYYFIQKHYC